MYCYNTIKSYVQNVVEKKKNSGRTCSLEAILYIVYRYIRYNRVYNTLRRKEKYYIIYIRFVFECTKGLCRINGECSRCTLDRYLKTCTIFGHRTANIIYFNHQNGRGAQNTISIVQLNNNIVIYKENILLSCSVFICMDNFTSPYLFDIYGALQ